MPKRGPQTLLVSGNGERIAGRTADAGVEMRKPQMPCPLGDRIREVGRRGCNAEPSSIPGSLQHRSFADAHDRDTDTLPKQGKAGIAKALTMIPRRPGSCLVPISTTSPAAAASSSGFRIIRGLRLAVALATARRPFAAFCAMETIISLVACELFGLISRRWELTF